MSEKPASKGSVFPGIVAAVAIAGAAILLADWIGSAILHATGPSPVSPITVAILIGIFIGNTAGVSPALSPGLEFCVKKVLRLGIVLIGLKLALGDVQKLAICVPVVMGVIAGGLSLTLAISRWAGLPDGLGLLTAAATSICGVTAAVSVAPVIEATEEELSYAVANVTLFGVIGMLFYPYLAHGVFGAASKGAGLFLGTSIHDTSQVMGAALSYKQLFADETAFNVATVTKLTRNVFLVVVVPLLAWLHARRGGAKRAVKVSDLFPTFVLGFLAMVLVRTAGDAMWPGKTGPAETWIAVHKGLADKAGVFCLGAALASVGLTTNLRKLRNLGLKPLFVGACAALLVGGLGMGLAMLAVRFSTGS